MGGQNFRLRIFEFFGLLLIERKKNLAAAAAAARAEPQRFFNKKNVALNFQGTNGALVVFNNIESIIPISEENGVEPDLLKCRVQLKKGERVNHVGFIPSQGGGEGEIFKTRLTPQPAET